MRDPIWYRVLRRYLDWRSDRGYHIPKLLGRLDMWYRKRNAKKEGYTFHTITLPVNQTLEPGERLDIKIPLKGKVLDFKNTKISKSRSSSG